MVVSRCQHIDSVQEIEPVGTTRQVGWQRVGLGKVAVGKVSFRQRTSNQRPAVHLRIVSQIEAHYNGITTTHGIADGIALYLLAWHETDTWPSGKGNRRMTDKELRQGHRFRACKVGEPKTEHAATKAHPDGVTQREVFGIGGFTPVGDRGGITPASHPFVINH